MKTASRIAVLVPLCLIAGCSHKTKATPPPAAQAPIYPPSEVAKNAPAPQLPPPNPLNVKKEEAPPPPPPPKPHKTTHHKQKPSETTPTQPAKDAAAPTTATTQQAAAGEPPEMSPIGQLSSTNEHGGVPSRQEILEQITTTQNGLNGIKRSLSSDEQLTMTQIRTFLTKARQALDQDDLDGANTLVTKAKVLLTELMKSG
jgi:outer membrane biosynthesis protein TonB